MEKNGLTKDEALHKLLSIDRRGPDSDKYDEVTNIFSTLDTAKVRLKYLVEIDNCSLDSFRTTVSMHGHVCMKPHGYNGDFEMIERIYNNYISDEYQNWDRYFQQGTATAAVRGRKDYFINKFTKLLKENPKCSVLNVASGPCTDLYELGKKVELDQTKITCIDIDSNAIRQGMDLLSNYSKIEFFNENILKYKTKNKFDIIWCAGLFDYLDDRVASFLIKRFKSWLNPQGIIIFGNFGFENIQRHYMHFGGWDLIHRNEDDLLNISISDGYSVKIESEENGVNLFSVIKSN